MNYIFKIFKFKNRHPKLVLRLIFLISILNIQNYQDWAGQAQQLVPRVTSCFNGVMSGVEGWLCAQLPLHTGAQH